MRESDLLRFVWIADPQISPDGRCIAFTRVHVDAEADEYRTHLWLQEIPAPGQAPVPPRALTFGGRDSQPRWSPDGQMLAFVRKGEAKDSDAQLHVLPLQGGEARVLTTIKRGVSSPAWSPDGRRLAFLSGHHPTLDAPDVKAPAHEPARIVTRPEFRWNDQGFVDLARQPHVWVIDVAGGPPRALTCGGPLAESSPAWTPDGRHVLFISDRRETPWYELPDSDVWAVPVDLAEPTDGAALVRVADIRGPILQFTPGPDGRLAAVGSVLAEAARSYDQSELLLFEGAWPMTTPRRLTAPLDLAINEGLSADQHPPRGGGAKPLAFTEGGLLAVADVHGGSVVGRLDLASGAWRELTARTQDVVCGSASADGSRLALTVGDVGTPGDLAVLDTASGALRILHRPNAEWLAETPLGEVEEMWIEGFDGMRLQGWLLKPPDFDPARRYPLILQIHGGPHVPYGAAFFHEFRVLSAAGYLVLYTNPRGSTSYGSAFANVIQYAYPGDDWRDLETFLDHVITQGHVDPSRLGVTGGSGGGLLTNWGITRTDRFRCAITQRCVADWASMVYSCDFAMMTPSWFRRQPYEDPVEYAQRSPATFLERVNTPLMVIHSEEDWRTPIGQGEIMFRGLFARRKPVVMVRFPGENHELSRSGTPSRRVQNQEHLRRWFDHWLLGKPAPEYGLH